MIILKNTNTKKELSKQIIVTTLLVKVTSVLNHFNLSKRYNRAVSNADLEKANRLKLTDIKKYWRHIGKVQMELDWLYN